MTAASMVPEKDIVRTMGSQRKPKQEQAVCDFAPYDYPPRSGPFGICLSQYRPGASRKSVTISLRRIARIASAGEVPAEKFAWHRLRFEHVARIRERLEGGYAPSTQNHTLSCLRSIIRTCWRLELISGEDRERLSDVRGFRESGQLRGRALSHAELERLFAALASGGDSTRVKRDGALLSVLFAAGLRRQEAISLSLRDYDPKIGTLAVAGKGGRARTGYLQAGPRKALDSWVRARGRKAGPLFCTVLRSGKVEPQPMSPRAVYKLCHAWAKKAKIPAFAPHDLRRTFVTHLLDAGVDLGTAQALAGHALVKTTILYDRRGESAKQAASLRLAFPEIHARR